MATTAQSVQSGEVVARAYFLGQSIKLTSLLSASLTPSSPLILPIEPSGYGVLFAYGAVVLFGLSEVASQAFLATLAPYLEAAFEQPETESVTLQLGNGKDGKVQDGWISLSGLDLPRLQIVAEVLAKSVVLAHYEIGAAQVFDQIEPYAAELQQGQQTRPSGDQLLKQIGHTLMIQNKIVGRVEIVDKPELLWEYPELDPLYRRLEDEYEIRERHSVLERKLDLVSRTAETVLDLQRQQTGLRLEFYVVILIVVEVLLSLYDLFIRP
ncbi:MAG TPA: RMD1 family protein [Leptolyngbyaceae cyanobacterium M65_K2018_010]|nr:RMD1 family protein [Leptolyngbyaceae cyanobacterium M65_K2018_010]